MQLYEAARRLAEGGIAIYPTETFYAIGCRADRADSVSRIFAAKRRPSGKPLPLIAGSATMALEAVLPGSKVCEDIPLLARFWPGPLTLLLPCSPVLPHVVTAGTGMAAIRVSSHPAARKLALHCGFPLVSTSANISGRPPARTAAELDRELLDMLHNDSDALVTAAPEPSGGAPSTIIMPLGGRRFRLIREGILPVATLASAGFLRHD